MWLLDKSTFQNTISELQLLLQKKEQALLGLCSEMEAEKKEKAQQRAELLRVQELLESEQRARHSLVDERNELHAEREDLKSKMNLLQRQHSDFVNQAQSRLSHLQMDKDKAEHKVEGLEKEKACLEVTVAEAIEKNKAVENRAAALAGQLQELTIKSAQERNEMQRRVQLLSGDLERRNATLHKMSRWMREQMGKVQAQFEEGLALFLPLSDGDGKEGAIKDPKQERKEAATEAKADDGEEDEVSFCTPLSSTS